MSRIKSFIKASGIYFIGNISCKLVSFLLLPLYTEILAPDQMGTYDVSVAYMSFFMSLLYLDIPSSTLRFMMDKEGAEKYKAIKISYIIFSMSTVCYVVSMIIAGQILSLEFIYLLLLQGFIQTLYNLQGNIIRGMGYNAYYAATGLVSTIITLTLNILLLKVAKLGYESFYISAIVSGVAGTIILEFKTKTLSRIFKETFDSELFKKMLKFCLPLCINSAAYWFLSSFNKVVINNYLSAEENGYYAIAFKFTNIITLMASCFQMAWQEMSYRAGADNTIDLGAFYTRANNLQIKLLSCAVLGAIPCVGIIFPYIINEQYWASQPIIPYYIIATALTIMSSMLGNALSSIKKTKQLFVCTLCAAIINVIMMLLLVKKIGVLAGAISLMCGYCVDTVLRWIVLRKHTKQKFNSYLAIGLLIAGCVAEIFIYNRGNNWYNFIGLAIAIFLCCVILAKEFIELYKLIKRRREND